MRVVPRWPGGGFASWVVWGFVLGTDQCVGSLAFYVAVGLTRGTPASLVEDISSLPLNCWHSSTALMSQESRKINN